MQNEIHIVSRTNLDLDKYDFCVNNSETTCIYAVSWYMDAVCKKGWNAVVLNAYEAVIPFYKTRTRKTKFQNKVIQPLFSQTLGLLSIEDLEQPIIDQLYSKLFEQKIYNYCFHSNSILPDFLKKNIQKRKNYILSLSPSYDDLWQNFAPKKRNKIRKSEKRETHVKKGITIIEFVNFIVLHNPIQFNSKKIEIVRQLLENSKTNNALKLYSFDLEGEICAVGAFLQFQNRIYYILSASNETGRKYAGMDAIMNEVIKENSSINKVLDFEGSELLGVESFIQKFGATLEPYYVYSAV